MTTLLEKTIKSAAAAALLVTLLHGIAFGEEAWRQSFEETCSKTSQAMTLSIEELNALVQKCDALQKVVETQEESVRKVFLKRLQLCRNLYAYVLDYKKNEQSSKK